MKIRVKHTCDFSFTAEYRGKSRQRCKRKSLYCTFGGGKTTMENSAYKNPHKNRVYELALKMRSS